MWRNVFGFLMLAFGIVGILIWVAVLAFALLTFGGCSPKVESWVEQPIPAAELRAWRAEHEQHVIRVYRTTDETW